MYYLLVRPVGSTDWFPVYDETYDEVQQTYVVEGLSEFDMVTAIMCANIMVGTRETRTDGLVIDEVIIANTETGESVGKWERTKQLDLLQEPTRAS